VAIEEAAKDRAVSDNPAADRAIYYRQMAALARAKADAMIDYQARCTMLEVAALWDAMAENAERSARDPKRSSRSSTAAAG
jgi:hypothetical protein